MKKIAKSIFVFMGACSMLWIASITQAATLPNGAGNTYKVPNNHQQKEETATTSKNGVQYTYEFRDSKKTSINILKIETEKKKVVIPAKIEGCSVYRISGPNFKSAATVKTVIIQNGVKEIGDGAFAYQNQLESVVIPKSVKKIFRDAFLDNVKLKKIQFKNLAIKIGESAFDGCSNLQKISFPQGEFTGRIGKSAFDYCNLKRLSLPYMKKIEKQIGRFAFANNKNLKQVTFSGRFKNISLGEGWFSDCPKVQITVGKQVKTFSSGVQAKSGTVRLLGRQTRLTGFKKPKGRSYYYIQFKKFIVPKNSKALKILRNAEYGTVSDTWSDRYDSEPNYYFSTSEADMHKVKVVIK